MALISLTSRAATDGPAVRGLEAAGRGSAAVIRLVTLVPTVVVALVAGLDPATGGVPAGVLVPAVAAVTVWSVVYAWWVRPRRHAALALADVVVLAALALGAVELVPPAWRADGASWIVPFLAFAGVGYQYSCSRVVGVGATLGLTAAATTGAVLAVPAGATNSTVVSSIWSGATGLLAALLWDLVRRGGARADALRAEREDAERHRDVAEALRRDQRALVAALHDTAAATLLVVGLGDVPAGSGRIAARARRDLETLHRLEDPATTAVGADLVAELRRVAESAPVTVTLTATVVPPLPPAVCGAFVGAVTEAVANTARHSGVAVANLAVVVRATSVAVTVSDTGSGFDRERVPRTRRGVRESIEARMAAVGGGARVDTQPGRGTSVLLTWASGADA